MPRSAAEQALYRYAKEAAEMFAFSAWLLAGPAEPLKWPHYWAASVHVRAAGDPADTGLRAGRAAVTNALAASGEERYVLAIAALGSVVGPLEAGNPPADSAQSAELAEVRSRAEALLGDRPKLLEDFGDYFLHYAYERRAQLPAEHAEGITGRYQERVAVWEQEAAELAASGNQPGRVLNDSLYLAMHGVRPAHHLGQAARSVWQVMSAHTPGGREAR